MPTRDVPEAVRRRAIADGSEAWLEALPALVADLERDWSIRVGKWHAGGTESFVADATREDGSQVVLKLLVPRQDDMSSHEITALRLANGEGCVRLLGADERRGALLLERLGTPLFELGLPLAERHEILCATAIRLWRPAPDCGLPTGAEKGRFLIDQVTALWEELGRPCSERAVDHALACASRRIAAHDDERAVLVHGDVHQWNALQADDGFKLVDPDGLLAEAEYDMGILMREDPLELRGDGRERAARLARRTGLDATAIWEWSVVERVSTGLAATRIDLQPEARQLLAAADRASASGDPD